MDHIINRVDLNITTKPSYLDIENWKSQRALQKDRETPQNQIDISSHSQGLHTVKQSYRVASMINR